MYGRNSFTIVFFDKLLLDDIKSLLMEFRGYGSMIPLLSGVIFMCGNLVIRGIWFPMTDNSLSFICEPRCDGL